MKKSRIGACALALATAAAICVPGTALAAAPTVTDPENPNVVASDGTQSSELTGTINATTISVSVPTKATFNVDPTVTAGVAADADNAHLHGQFESPANYQIVNGSKVPVYAYISKVETPTSGTVADLVLTKKTGEVSGHTIQFAVVGAGGPTLALDNEAGWLATGTTQYYAFNAAEKGKIAAGDSGNTAAMDFYGAVSEVAGVWAQSDTFVVQPTFTITTTKPADVTPGA